MEFRAEQDDTKTETSTGAVSILTPPTNIITGDDPRYSRNYQVPWPGNTYMIIEKDTDRAITLTSTGLCLQDIEQDPNANNHWQCVDSNNYMAFYNPTARVYMGHDNGETVRATAWDLQNWELIQPRHHPDGGYQLMLPHWWHTMLMVTAEEWGRLRRTRRGTTLWQFVQV